MAHSAPLSNNLRELLFGFGGSNGGLAIRSAYLYVFVGFLTAANAFIVQALRVIAKLHYDWLISNCFQMFMLRCFLA